MLLFFLIFLSIYGAMNAYVFWRVHAAFPGMGRWNLVLLAFLVLVAAAPFLARALDSARQAGAARAVSLVGYLWLAVVFWFCVMGWLVDGWNQGVKLLALAFPPARGALAPARPVLFAIVALILVAVVWGWREAGSIRVESITLETDRLPPGVDSLRVAQITDLHLGSPRSELRLAEAVRLLRRLNPDVIVSTGDLVDGDFHTIAPLADALRELRPPMGKFAVFGNHEFYAGVENSLKFHELAGFRVLRGESFAPAEGLLIAGVDDPAGRRMGEGSHTDGSAALAAGDLGALPASPLTAATIFLKHQPRLSAESVGRFDVQLSGHTHGGQIFPWIFITNLTYPVRPGLHRLPWGGTVYVSRGTGTWGPPLRVGSPPEVTLITLRRATAAAQK